MSKIKVVHYYTYPSGSGGPLSYIRNIISSPYLSENFEFYCVWQQKPLSALKKADIHRITAEIQSYSPDIVHIHGLQGEGFIGMLCARRAKCKTLVTVHGTQLDEQGLNPIKAFLYRRLERYTLRHADCVYCVSQAAAARRDIAGYTDKMYGCLYNFVPDKQRTAFCEAVPYRKRVENELVCVYVGRTSFDKGMEELATAIDGTDNSVKYIIVGEGDRYEMLRNRYADSERVFLTGAVDNVLPYLKSADCFVFPSHHENLSIALLEAVCAGLCCIVSDIDGNTEVVRNEKEGIYFSMGDGNALCRAINRIAENKSERALYAKAAAQRAECFSEQTFAKALTDIYTSLKSSTGVNR